jgi:hypothetical protein
MLPAPAVADEGATAEVADAAMDEAPERTEAVADEIEAATPVLELSSSSSSSVEVVVAVAGSVMVLLALSLSPSSSVAVVVGAPAAAVLVPSLSLSPSSSVAEACEKVTNTMRTAIYTRDVGKPFSSVDLRLMMKPRGELRTKWRGWSQ